MRPAFNPRNWGAAPVVALGWLLAKLPHRLALRIGAAVGQLAWHLHRQRRRIADRNISACLPHLDAAQQSDVVRRSFIATGQGMAASAAACWGRDNRIAAWGTVRGLEHLQAADGRGTLVLMAHYPWLDLAGRFVNLQRNQPVLGMARKHNNAWLDDALRRGRLRHCGEVFAKEQMRGVMRALRQGKAIFYAADQNFNHDFVFAPFFGVPASCVKALGQLVERTRCRVVPMWCELHDGHYRVELQPAWDEDEGKDPESAARTMNQWIEQQLQGDPSQYLWLHRRFKNQPEGTAPFYAPDERRAKHR